MMSKHKQEEEARIIALASPVLIPSLERREQVTINNLINDYRSGASNLASRVAELATLRDLIREIKQKAAQNNA